MNGLERTMRNFFHRSLLVSAGLAAVLALGCSDILQVELPGKIPTELLNDPLTAPTLATSVVADFECAFSNYVTSTATLSDQFLGASGNLNAKNWGTKKIPEDDASNERTTCNGSYGAYTPLQTARFQANDIGTRLRGWTDSAAQVPLAPLRARVAVFGAYAHIFLGEGYCALRFDLEQQIRTPQEVLAIAEAKFDTALTLVNAIIPVTARDTLMRDSLVNLVYAGRTRVRLDRGDKAGAAADAALVTAGFEYFVTRSADADSRVNDAFIAMVDQRHTSVDPQYRNLTVGGTPDPRVQVAAGPAVGRPQKAFDGVTDLYVVTNKNFSRSDPMRLASSIESELIRAEAALGATAVGIINARRAQLGLPDYTGATDSASVTALILDERNREFFMEGGQRYNDLLRYNIPWKVGNDQNGVPYGTTTCMPLPLNERLGGGG
jgi:hypothetical protein